VIRIEARRYSPDLDQMPENPPHFGHTNGSTSSNFAGSWAKAVAPRPSVLLGRIVLRGVVENANAVVDTEARLFPGQKVAGKAFIQWFAFYQRLDHPTAEYLDHGLEFAAPDGEDTNLVKWTSLQARRSPLAEI